MQQSGGATAIPGGVGPGMSMGIGGGPGAGGGGSGSGGAMATGGGTGMDMEQGPSSHALQPFTPMSSLPTFQVRGLSKL